MSIVWDAYPGGGSELLLALALADHADDKGDRIYPSVKHLALKTRLSERTVQYLLREMEGRGWLIVVAREAYKKARRYRIPIERVQSLHPSSPAKRVQPGVEKGEKQRKKGATAIAPESSLTTTTIRTTTTGSCGGGDCLPQTLALPPGLSGDEKGKALEIVSRLSPAQGQAVLDEMEGALRSSRIKSNRLGWLRKVTESAAQDEFSPELGIRVAEERRLRVQREAHIHAPQPKSWQEELIDQKLESTSASARASPVRHAGKDARGSPGTDGDPVSCDGVRG